VGWPDDTLLEGVTEVDAEGCEFELGKNGGEIGSREVGFELGWVNEGVNEGVAEGGVEGEAALELISELPTGMGLGIV